MIDVASADLSWVEAQASPAWGSATVADYWALLKPRVMSLVVFTGFAGFWVAPGYINPVLGAVAILCIAVGAGASGAINMWYDRDVDAVMSRTQGRPLPSGRMLPDDALAFGVVLACASVILMGLAVNPVAALLLAFTIFFYVFIYTVWLKRRTPQNIVIGGAAGAFPPMIGWTAVTGDIGLPSLLLFALIFFWTPPHFWALALYRSEDYAKAGVPMMPVVAGPSDTKRQMLLYTLILWPVSIAPFFIGLVGKSYLGVTLILNACLTAFAVQVLARDGERGPKRMFAFSILYLTLIFAMLIADRVAPHVAG